MIISYDYLSTLTLKVGSSLLNFDSAFSNLAAPYDLEGFRVRVMTGSGTNILWHLTG